MILRDLIRVKYMSTGVTPDVIAATKLAFIPEAALVKHDNNMKDYFGAD